MRTDVATSASLEEVNYIVKLTKRLCKLKKKKWGGVGPAMGGTF